MALAAVAGGGDEGTRAGGARLWRAVATGVPPVVPGALAPAALAPAAVQRFADVVSPALAAHLLGGHAVAPQAAAHSRLNNRLTGGIQRNWVREIAALGIATVYLKGFALAHTLYDDPDTRTTGDIDVLVHGAGRDRLIAALAARGFRFRPLPQPPWGFISRASYAPFVSADGLCNLDIHIHPDCYPAYRSLTTELVFARARAARIGDVTISVPDPSHSFLLCATNAAKDKFGRHGAGKLVDAMALARRHDLDWPGLAQLARDGGYQTPYAVFLALLARLGVAPTDLPRQCPPLPWRAARAFAAMARDVEALYPAALGPIGLLRREATLCTDPLVGLHNFGVRSIGLFRARRGVPENAPVV